MAKTSKTKRPKLDPLVPEDPSNGTPERLACQGCGLFRDSKVPFRRAWVPKKWTRLLLLVGEGLVGTREGKLLREILELMGFTPDEIAFVPEVKCQPQQDPTMDQIRACRPLLLGEIKQLQPLNVMGLGTFAARALTNDGQAAVTRLRGRPLELTQKENDNGSGA